MSAAEAEEQALENFVTRTVAAMPSFTHDQVSAIAGLLAAARDLPPVEWETEPDPEIRLRRAMAHQPKTRTP